MSPGFQLWKFDLPNLEFIPSKFGKWPYGESPNLEGRNSKFGRSKFQIWKPGDIEDPLPEFAKFYFQMSSKNPTLYSFSANPKLLEQLFQRPHMETFQLFQKVL
jgi:hypothetical protein